MGLTMSQRKAVTKAIATRYRRAAGSRRAGSSTSCARRRAGIATTRARRWRAALRPRMVSRARRGHRCTDRKSLRPLGSAGRCSGQPTGKRLAPVLPDLVATLRRFGELEVSDETAALLVGMSPATIDRRLAPDRGELRSGAARTPSPGRCSRSQIPIRTWAQWDDAVPGFVEIDLVGHEGGNAIGEHAYTLTVTDIATGWTENRSVPQQGPQVGDRRPGRRRQDRCRSRSSGSTRDNGSEFINYNLLALVRERKITFTRSRPGNCNDGAHVEQKNWAIVRTVVGYHRYDTAAELVLLNKIWALQSQLTNYFLPQQKLLSKVRDGAKVTKKYDSATTPHRRAGRHPQVSAEDKTILDDT